MKLTLFIFIGLIGLIGLIHQPVTRHLTPVPRNETVVLLHGLCRSSRSMNKMARELTTADYTVINVNYPSRSATIEELTDEVFQPLEKKFPEFGKIHFVTHSMGGILLTEYLQDHTIKNLGNVVMLAPPTRGSEVPDKLGELKLYQWINGPAGNQLGTGTGSLPLRLKEPEMELGVIAGDRSINPILSMLIPGPDDGKVSLARVRNGTETDFVRLHVTHACMMWNRQVIHQTIAFLKTGAFQKGDS
ncbi:MAG: esterase/lipase family protein [Kiritimatiellales bacterium]